MPPVNENLKQSRNQKGVYFGESTGNLYKLNEKTGDFDPFVPYDASKDEKLQDVRAVVEGALPAIRPIAALASAAFPNPATDSLNPYKGKPLPAAVLGGAADIANTVTNLAMPAKGAIANVAKYTVPAALGLVSKKVGELISKNKSAQKLIESPGAQNVIDYGLPVVSLLLNGGVLKGLSSKTSGTITKFAKENPNAVENMFEVGTHVTAPGSGVKVDLKGTNMINTSNTPAGLAASGFKSAEGFRAQVGEDLFTNVKLGIKKVGDEYKQVFGQVKDVPVPPQKINQLIGELQASKPKFTYDSANQMLVKDIDNFILKLKAMKKPTVESVDALKQAWRSETLSDKPTFQKPYSAGVATEIGNKIGSAAEDVLTSDLKAAFKKTKGDYHTMADARDELDAINRFSAEQIMQKITSADKLGALEKLIDDPKVINAALKSDSQFKFPADPVAMMNDYLEKIRRIDAVNPDLAAKLFKTNELPIYTSPTIKKAATAAQASQSLNAELNERAKRSKEAALEFLKPKK
jgi:hypothetical protein